MIGITVASGSQRTFSSDARTLPDSAGSVLPLITTSSLIVGQHQSLLITSAANYGSLFITEVFVVQSLNLEWTQRYASLQLDSAD